MIENFVGLEKKHGVIQEVTEDLYFEALGAVPPVSGAGFWAMGEIYSHDGRGREIYYCFGRVLDTRNGEYKYFGTLANMETARALFRNLYQAL